MSVVQSRSSLVDQSDAATASLSLFPCPSTLLRSLVLEEISCNDKLTSYDNLGISAVAFSKLSLDPFGGQMNDFDRMTFLALIAASGERDILVFSVATREDLFRNCLLAHAKS